MLEGQKNYFLNRQYMEFYKNAEGYCVLIIITEFTFYTPANVLMAFRNIWHFSWVHNWPTGGTHICFAF